MLRIPQPTLAPPRCCSFNRQSGSIRPLAITNPFTCSTQTARFVHNSHNLRFSDGPHGVSSHRGSVASTVRMRRNASQGPPPPPPDNRRNVCGGQMLPNSMSGSISFGREFPSQGLFIGPSQRLPRTWSPRVVNTAASAAAAKAASTATSTLVAALGSSQTPLWLLGLQCGGSAAAALCGALVLSRVCAEAAERAEAGEVCLGRLSYRKEGVLLAYRAQFGRG